MALPLTLMTVHAHPDDETIATGGTMARYAARGDRVVCVTCTDGAHGEIVVPEMDTPENHAGLADIRREELARALTRLGSIEHHWLGYVDSGMMGTLENELPGSFWQADLEEATGRLVRLVRQVRPDVIAGYNDFGGYGHPDHIRAALVAKAAFERAGDPKAFSEQLIDGLEPWAPTKLYETVFDLSRREEIAKLAAERGIESWWSEPENESEEEREARLAYFGKMQDAVGPVTTRVNIREQTDAKFAALREHVTQIAPKHMFLALTPAEWADLQPTEDYTLRVSRVGVRIPEDDLFDGLRD